MREPNVVVVNPSLPTRTVPEFIAYSKANSGKINMASAGNGSTSHLAGELFNRMTDVNLVHVPYRGGGPALTDLLAGQVQVFSSQWSADRAGQGRQAASTRGDDRDPLAGAAGHSEVGEFVPGYEASVWFGLGAPKATPAEIVEKLNQETNAALADPKIKARMADLGGNALTGSPADFGKLVAEETEKWAKVIRAANIKAEECDHCRANIP